MVLHWPKELLIWHCTVLWASGTINPDYIITNSVNWLKMYSKWCTNYPLLSQFGPCFKTYQKLWYVHMYLCNSTCIHVHVYIICTCTCMCMYTFMYM